MHVSTLSVKSAAVFFFGSLAAVPSRVAQVVGMPYANNLQLVGKNQWRGDGIEPRHLPSLSS